MKSPKPALVPPGLEVSRAEAPVSGLGWSSSAVSLSSPSCPVFQEFIKMTNHDVEHAIKKRMSGDVRDAFVAIGQCCLCTRLRGQAAPPAGTAKAGGSRFLLGISILGHGDSTGAWVGALAGSLERARPALLYQGGLVAETVLP